MSHTRLTSGRARDLPFAQGTTLKEPGRLIIAYKENNFYNYVRIVEPTIVDNTVLRESESIAISSSKATVTWSQSCHQRARHVGRRCQEYGRSWPLVQELTVRRSSTISMRSEMICALCAISW